MDEEDTTYPQHGIVTTIYKSQKIPKDRKKARKIGKSDEITVTINEFGILIDEEKPRLGSDASDDEKASVMSDERAYTAGGPAKPISGENPKCVEFNRFVKVVKSLPNAKGAKKVKFFGGNDIKNRSTFYKSSNNSGNDNENENEIIYGLPQALIPIGTDLTNIVESNENDKILGCVVGDSVEIIMLKRSDKIDNLLDFKFDSQQTDSYGFNQAIRDKYGIDKDDIMYFDLFISRHSYEASSAQKDSTPCGVCCTIL